MRCNMTDFGYQDKNRISFSYNSTDTDAKAQSFSNCGDTYNLVFVRSGSGKCVIEGREYPITAGSVLIAKPLEYYYENAKAILNDIGTEEYAPRSYQ